MNRAPLRSVYADDHIEVLFRAADSDLLMVTFNHATFRVDGNTFWGVKRAEKLGCAALGIVSKSVNWFPNASMQAAVIAAAPLMAQFSEILTLGFSMGAYGALKYGALLKAHLTVAFSPQSPTVRASLPNSLESKTPDAFVGLDVGPADVCARCYVFYDPLVAVDRLSMQVITSSGTPLTATRTYGSGHASMQVFKKNIDSVIQAARTDDRMRLSVLWAQARRADPRRGAKLTESCVRRHPAWAQHFYEQYKDLFSAEEAAGFLLELIYSSLRARDDRGAHRAIQLAASVSLDERQSGRLRNAREVLGKRRAGGIA